MFPHLLPSRNVVSISELRIEIKRRKRRDSLTAIENSTLAAATTPQRTFGKERFIVVGVPKSPTKNKTKKKLSKSRGKILKNKQSIHKIPVSKQQVLHEPQHMNHHVQKPWERYLPTSTTTTTTSDYEEVPHPLSREKYQRRRSSATRRQSMFGAFLFDFVCQRQREADASAKNQHHHSNRRRSKNQRRHLASVTSPLSSPGREENLSESEETITIYSTTKKIHYDARKHADSLPNSPEQLRTRSNGLSESWTSHDTNSSRRSAGGTLYRSKSTSSMLPKRRNSMFTSSEMKVSIDNSGRTNGGGGGLISELRQQYDPTGEGQKKGRKDLYTDKALLQREALRFDENVLHELNRIWRLVDVDNNHEIDFDEFSIMHHKLFILYHGHLDGQEIPTKEEENTMLQDDWQKDVAPLNNFDFKQNILLGENTSNTIKFNKKGIPIMTKNHFVKSWFHMADMWTDNISAELYTNFLRFTVSKIAVVSADGKLQWRKDDDITGLMKEHHMTEEERNQRRLDAGEESRQAEIKSHQQRNQNGEDNMKVIIGDQREHMHPQLHVEGSSGEMYGLRRETGKQHHELDENGNGIRGSSNSDSGNRGNNGVEFFNNRSNHSADSLMENAKHHHHHNFKDRSPRNPEDGVATNVDAGNEWLGSSLPRKGPPSRVAIYAQKPSHAITRARMSPPPAFGAHDTRRRGGMRHVDSEGDMTDSSTALNAHIGSTNALDNNNDIAQDDSNDPHWLREKRRLERERKKGERNRIENEKRRQARETLAFVHGGSTPFARRPHRLLGSAPGLKSPTSTNGNGAIPSYMWNVMNNNENNLSEEWRGEKMDRASTFQSLGGFEHGRRQSRTSTLRSSSLYSGRSSPTGRSSYSSVNSLSKHQRAQSAGPLGRGSSQRIALPASPVVMIKKASRNNRPMPPPTTASVSLSPLSPTEPEDDEVDSFALFGLAERGVALRREYDEEKEEPSRISTLQSMTIGNGGIKGKKISRSNTNISRLYGSDSLMSTTQKERKKKKKKKKRPSTANANGRGSRRKSLKEQLLLTSTTSKTTTRLRRKRRPKSATTSSASSLKTQDRLMQHQDLSRIPPVVSPMSRHHSSSRKRIGAIPASAGRDRKRQALFDRYFSKGQKVQGVEEDADEEEEEEEVRRRRVGEKKDEIVVLNGGRIPARVLLRKPNWDKYLIK